MTTRPRLSDKIVFTVDAPRADYWRGETYDVWDGQTWTRSDENDTDLLARDPSTTNTDVPPAFGDTGAVDGTPLTQTFHMETGYDDIVFGAPSVRTVESDKLLVGRPDGTVAVAAGSSGFGKGAVYTVVSRSLPTTEAALRAADSQPVPAQIRDMYAQQPVATTRVRDLARQVTAASPTTYDKVKALEAWMGANLHYSLNAPLSPPGVDVVDNFLFNSKQGWCEQIASSLVVLARSVGIPPLGRARTRCPRVGRDLLPGHRVAGVRSHGVGAARRRRPSHRIVVRRRASQRGAARDRAHRRRAVDLAHARRARSAPSPPRPAGIVECAHDAHTRAGGQEGGAGTRAGRNPS